MINTLYGSNTTEVSEFHCKRFFSALGDLLVACSVKTTEVIRARLPDREKIVTIPRSSAILFTLLPRDGDEGSLLGQKWEGIFNVSELIRVEPLPPVSEPCCMDLTQRTY